MEVASKLYDALVAFNFHKSPQTLSLVSSEFDSMKHANHLFLKIVLRTSEQPVYINLSPIMKDYFMHIICNGFTSMKLMLDTEILELDPSDF